MCISVCTPEGKHVDKSFFFPTSVLFVYRKRQRLCWWRHRAMSLLLLQTKGHYPLGRLAELKHVVGLTKQPPKTLPIMQGTPAQLHTRTHAHTHTHNMYTISVWGGGVLKNKRQVVRRSGREDAVAALLQLCCR